jgi:hypothetical protein
MRKAELLISAAQARFQSLWSALECVYFHELEDDQSGNQFSIDHEFDAATDPEVSNLWTTVQNATLDVEIDEWFASLKGGLPLIKCHRTAGRETGSRNRKPPVFCGV